MPLPRPAPGTRHWWVIGIVGVLAMTAAIVWYGLVTEVGALRPQVTGYAVLSPSAVTVDYQLGRPAGVAVVCTIVALDASKGRVGTVTDAVPAGPETLVRRTVEIRTSAKAVTGVVDSCVRR